MDNTGVNILSNAASEPVSRVRVDWDEVSLPRGVAILAFAEPNALAALTTQTDPDINLLLVSQPSLLGPRVLEVCAGTVERGETAEQAAARELEEELGRVATTPHHLGRLFLFPRRGEGRVDFFVTDWSRRVAPTPEPGEDIVSVCVPLPEVRRLVSNGRIFDAKTLSALYLLEAWIAVAKDVHRRSALSTRAESAMQVVTVTGRV